MALQTTFDLSVPHHNLPLSLQIVDPHKRRLDANPNLQHLPSQNEQPYHPTTPITPTIIRMNHHHPCHQGREEIGNEHKKKNRE
eukprot:m.148813 g.148813  ORF g.148813 m.148813 type:complete len:84 (+) comp13264_c3_seq1:131-382(+)